MCVNISGDRSSPRLAAQTGSKLCSMSTQPTALPVAFWCSIAVRMDRVVLQTPSGPISSCVRPRTQPPVRSARSRVSEPVEMISRLATSGISVSRSPKRFSSCLRKAAIDGGVTWRLLGVQNADVLELAAAPVPAQVTHDEAADFQGAAVQGVGVGEADDVDVHRLGGQIKKCHVPVRAVTDLPEPGDRTSDQVAAGQALVQQLGLPPQLLAVGRVQQVEARAGELDAEHLLLDVADLLVGVVGHQIQGDRLGGGVLAAPLGAPLGRRLGLEQLAGALVDRPG